MKLKRNHRREVLALALLLAGGFSAAAQKIPGDTDYSGFVQFISQRNIFDPNRYPHEVRSSYHSRSQRTHSNSSPVFTLVGMMDYEKGRFAFFSGNSYDLKKILKTGDSIVGYTVTEISKDDVKLKGPDTNTVTMNLGDQMRQENNGWQLVVQGDAAVGQGSGGVTASPVSTGGSSGSSAGSGADATPAPSANVSNNDVLKRLMELRQKANQ